MRKNTNSRARTYDLPQFLSPQFINILAWWVFPLRQLLQSTAHVQRMSHYLFLRNSRPSGSRRLPLEGPTESLRTTRFCRLMRGARQLLQCPMTRWLQEAAQVFRLIYSPKDAAKFDKLMGRMMVVA